jgi:hypothetical protein
MTITTDPRGKTFIASREADYSLSQARKIVDFENDRVQKHEEARNK